MVVDLKFSRFSEEPWGFRLTGGADFEFPLTVIKVTENSLAEQAGLKFGDIVVRINDTPASNLSHLEAHNVLLAAGNNFMIGVKRDNEPEEESPVPVEEEQLNNGGYVSDGEAEVREILYNVEAQKVVNPEELVEEQIAEVLSSEAEVLKEHNIMGVNFNKLIPKATKIKASAVLRELNNEAVMTDDDKLKEARKWTTFLQKPDRPIPKSKEQLAREKLPKYKVNIRRQPKALNVQADMEPTPAVVEGGKDDPIENVGQEVEEEEKIEEVEVTELEQVEDMLFEKSYIDPIDEMEALVAATADNDVPDLVRDENTGIPSDLEKQLADVQKQLLALSNLPQAIQATLDAVTTELAKIVPVIEAVNNSRHASMDREYRSKSPSRDIIPETEMVIIEETVEEMLEDQRNSNDVGEESESSSSGSSHGDECSEWSAERAAPAVAPPADVVPPPPPPKKVLTEQELYEQHQQELKEALLHRKNEAVFDDLIEEDSRARQRSKLVPGKLTQKTTSVFGPLVPQQRPIYLPGGRKWRTAKDAFNDEFIKEVISSQAELIVGSTLGTYESPLLPYDAKVNFLKYKKPEKKVDLKNSEVFRYLNNLETNPPQRGIEARPERYTEADVRRNSGQ